MSETTKRYRRSMLAIDGHQLTACKYCRALLLFEDIYDHRRWHKVNSMHGWDCPKTKESVPSPIPMAITGFLTPCTCGLATDSMAEEGAEEIEEP